MATNDLFPCFSPIIPNTRAAGDRKGQSGHLVANRQDKYLVVTAAAIVFAIVSVENPVVLFENAMASLFATSTPPDDTGQSMPSIQSTADAQALPPLQVRRRQAAKLLPFPKPPIKVRLKSVSHRRSLVK